MAEITTEMANMDDMTATNSHGPLLRQIIHAAIDWNARIHHYIGPEPMEKQEKIPS